MIRCAAEGRNEASDDEGGHDEDLDCTKPELDFSEFANMEELGKGIDFVSYATSY